MSVLWVHISREKTDYNVNALFGCVMFEYLMITVCIIICVCVLHFVLYVRVGDKMGERRD